jgi:adenylate cyclase
LQDMWLDEGYEQPFQMRIGLNTGYCNVGNFGGEDRMDYTIVGGEVNLASHLESAADPNGILMSFETYAMVRDLVEAEERPPFQAEGIRKKVRPFAVKGILDGMSDSKRFIRKELDGMLVVVDLDKLNGESRSAALGDLESIVDRMKSDA